MNPKVLYLTSDNQDYLNDGLLHGLRELLAGNVVDYPKQEILYKSYPPKALRQLHGRGFTLYGLLEDIPLDRSGVTRKVMDREYDLVVIGDVYRSWGLFLQLWPYLIPAKTAILDGADTPAIFPFAGKWWRRSYWRRLPTAHRRFVYFKREWTGDTLYFRCFRLLPRFLCRAFAGRMRLHRISFAIPEGKIVTGFPIKRKLLGSHVVDREVAAKLNVHTSYVFETEEAYYRDLQESKFAVTTRRAGWDCLRHYEIAANGCVPCFRDLDRKPATCSPHGLDESNCVIYHDANELLRRISVMEDAEYSRLQSNTLAWVRNNTTRMAAERLLGCLEL